MCVLKWVHFPFTGLDHFNRGGRAARIIFFTQSPGQCLGYDNSKIRWINHDCDSGFESPDIKEAVNQI